MLSKKTTFGINGEIIIPGDKSISHRSVIIPSLANGVSEISNLLMSDDVIHTINAFKLMGVKIEEVKNKLIIHGLGLNSLKKPNKEIYLGNSGTGARLLTGLLSSQNFSSLLTGDKSLSSRPMKRIIDPLTNMNAKFDTTNNKLPLKIIGSELKKYNHIIKIPSAQIKSGLILACLNTKGKSSILENHITRDHTEIMLDYFGADIEIEKNSSTKKILINGKKELIGKNIEVPSDLSSAAFLIVAALINSNSEIKLKNININPTRNGILTALELMGANIELKNTRKLNNENIADIIVKSSILSGCELSESMAELMIDEYPILAIAASFAKSPSIFRGLGELKVKESNRLELIQLNLERSGVDCKINGDDLYIDPTKVSDIKNNKIKTNFDHRIAMAFSILASKKGDLLIEDSNSISTSFPKFKEIFNNAGGNLIET